MSWATIAAAIKTELESVAGITGGAGKVMVGHPLVDRPDVYSTTFEGTTTINAWTIVRETYSERQKGDGFRFIATFGVRVRGYYARGTGTTATFDAIIDALATVIRGKTTIWVIQPESEEMILDIRQDNEYLGDVFCHFADIRFRVDEVKELSS